MTALDPEYPGKFLSADPMKLAHTVCGNLQREPGYVARLIQRMEANMTRRIIFILSLTLLTAQLMAAETTTLERIAKRGSFLVGFVPDAPPMSYINTEGKAVGYSIDLCRQIATAVRRKLGRTELKISYVPLIALEKRIASIEKGDVDIECGATTVTLSRRERVDFTLMSFITGASVLSRTDAPIASTQGIDEKTIAVIGGTTTESAIKSFLDSNNFHANLRVIEDHKQGIELLKAGKVDGYASDRAMLIGQALLTDEPEKYTVTRDVFSFEPYAFMVQRGDTEFRLLADRALAAVYGSARIKRLYLDWFGGQMVMPSILEAMYEFQAVGE